MSKKTMLNRAILPGPLSGGGLGTEEYEAEILASAKREEEAAKQRSEDLAKARENPEGEG